MVGTGNWMAALLVFAAVAAGVVALGVVVEWMGERRRRREVSRQLHALDEKVGAAAGSLLREEHGDQPAWVARLNERVPRVGDLSFFLEQSGTRLSLPGFLLLTGGLALALGLGALVAFGLGLVSVAAAALGAWLPYVVVRHKRNQRMARFEEQLPEAVDLVGRAIRAGHPVSAGFRMVSEEVPAPLGREFRQVFEEQRFGMSFEDSLLGLADRIALVDVRILVTAMLIQREVGGNLAEILDKLSHIIRERFTIRRQLRVITAEARMSMWVLIALPPAIGLIILFLNPKYVMTLFSDPMGKLMLYASLGMNFLGFLWIRRIVDIEI